jgi:protoporphyrin/coproporphyrin ferrochelatase
MAPYEAILLVSFGGPEGPADVLPFMENVTRGRGIPRERLVEVSAHYDLFGGVSPINGQNRELLAALGEALSTAGIDLPLYWGNRNWNPLLIDTMQQLQADGRNRVLAFVTSAYSSASGCRQYREDIIRSCAEVEASAGSSPNVDKIRVFYNHPGFIEPMVDAACAAIESFAESLGDGFTEADIRLACTAHSIPMSMADTSNYVQQLTEASRLVCQAVNERLGTTYPHQLVYQSRSGAPGQPWLEPDICDHLSAQHADGANAVVMIPVGFISDHMEVVYDLDTQARDHAAGLGLPVRRAATVGTDARFVGMIVELIQERIDLAAGLEPTRRAIGQFGANHDVCPFDCCPNPQRPASRPT